MVGFVDEPDLSSDDEPAPEEAAEPAAAEEAAAPAPAAAAEEDDDEEEAEPPEPPFDPQEDARPYCDAERDDERGISDKWQRYNEALICLMEDDYDGAEEILRPLTDEDDGEMAEDPDALYWMARVELKRAKDADDDAKARGRRAPSERAYAEKRRTMAMRSTNVVGDAMLSFGADVAPGAARPPPPSADGGDGDDAAPSSSANAAPFELNANRWDQFAAAKSAQSKFKGLLARRGSAAQNVAPPAGVEAAEHFLDRALEAIEAHGCCDDYDETLRKIHLEQMILAMESGDTRTARTLAEAGDIDLEAETRLVLAELLLKSGQEKGAARQTVLAVQSNNESRRTMRQTISKRGTHMNVRQKSMISHARGLRAAVAGLDEDDAMADMGLGLDWAFDEKPDMLVRE